MANKKVVVAFSGGLDTSYTVMKLTQDGWDVYAACANTGGFSAEQLKTNEENAYKLGAKAYVTLDIVMKTSMDKGATWSSPEQMVAKGGNGIATSFDCAHGDADVVVIIRLGFRISECIFFQEEIDAAILALNHGRIG